MTIKKLDISAEYFKGKSDALSRFYADIASSQKSSSRRQRPLDQICQYCKTFFVPGNHKYRIISRKKVNPKLVRLADKVDELKPMKQYLVKKAVKNSQTFVMITCFMCKKKTELEGFSQPNKQKKKKEKKAVEAAQVLTKSQKKKLKRKNKKNGDKSASASFNGLVRPSQSGNDSINSSLSNDSSVLSSPFPQPKALSTPVSQLKPQTKNTGLKELLKPKKRGKRGNQLQAMLDRSKNNSQNSGLSSFLSTL